MNRFHRVMLIAALPLAATLATAQTAVAPRAPIAPWETRVEFSLAGKSGIAEGSRALGDLSSFQARANFVRTIPNDGGSAWLLGAAWERFEFDSDPGAPIPESLSSLTLKLGYTRPLSAQWSLRAEIDPGLYSDFEDIDSGDFNAPAGMRLVYGVSRELQWFAGLNLDFRSGNPVIGGFGARWVFAPKWTLLFLIPAPRVEFEMSPQLTVFAGANLRGGTFRVSRDFGTRLGRPELDEQDVGYREIGVGLGARWKISPTIDLNIAGGWILDRRFEFDDRELLLNGKGAPNFQLSLVGSF